jgi:transposase-like protein
VLSLVNRDTGEARSFHIASTTMKETMPIVLANIRKESTVYTDEASHYRNLGDHFAKHDSVAHSKEEYARGPVSTNAIEGFFSIFKRGMRGVYQHCAERHLHRYLAEFDFRYTHRVVLA